MSRPLLGLSPRWISCCDDGSVEVRIAGALASIHATGSVGPLRSNLTAVDPEKPWQWSSGKGDRFWVGNNLPDRLGGILNRRIMDAMRRSAPRLPLESRLGIPAQDVMLFINGECDDEKIESLLWAFSLIDWKKTKTAANEIRKKWRQPLTKCPVSRTFAILKLLFDPYIMQEVHIRYEPRIIHILSAGRIADACDIAARRLRVSGLHPFDVAFEAADDPRRLLAGLLIPVNNSKQIQNLVLKKTSPSQTIPTHA